MGVWRHRSLQSHPWRWMEVSYQTCAQAALTPGKIPWVGLRGGLDVLWKRKISCLCRQSNHDSSITNLVALSCNVLSRFKSSIKIRIYFHFIELRCVRVCVCVCARARARVGFKARRLLSKCVSNWNARLTLRHNNCMKISLPEIHQSDLQPKLYFHFMFRWIMQ
jgi:hypothetical protein